MWSTRHEPESVCPNNTAMNFPLGDQTSGICGGVDRGWGNLSMTSNYRKNTFATDLQSVLVSTLHTCTLRPVALFSQRTSDGPSSEARLAHIEGESLAAQS